MQVLQHNEWNEQDASILTSSELITTELNDIVPVHAWLLEGDALKIDAVKLVAIETSLRMSYHNLEIVPLARLR
jgi:hypothetical protein